MKQHHKLCTKKWIVISTGKPNEVQSVENTTKNPQSFQQTIHMQKKKENPFELKEVNSFKEKLLESIEYSKFVSHKARISGEFD